MKGLENEPQSNAVIHMMKSAEAKKLLKEIKALLKDKNIPDQILTTYTEEYLRNKNIIDLADPALSHETKELHKQGIAEELNKKHEVTEQIKKKPKKT